MRRTGTGRIRQKVIRVFTPMVHFIITLVASLIITYQIIMNTIRREVHGLTTVVVP